MIFVDVQVPALEGSYDFELDEEMVAGEVATHILELISQKEKCTQKPERKMFLYAIKKEIILNPQKSLEQQGIQNGESLIVI